jgi:alpha-glucosidase
MRPFLVVGFAVVLGGACSTSKSTTPPVTSTIGAFDVSVSSDDAVLTIAAAEGTPLVEGIASSNDVGTPQSHNDDAPPMTGFAVRQVASTITTLYGAFSIVDDNANPWRVGATAREATPGGPIDVLDGGGARLASITFSQGLDSSSLVADVQPGDGPERRFSWGFHCSADDQFFGFGAQTWGVGARGQTIPIWVEEEGVGKDLTTDDPVGAWFEVGRHHSTGYAIPEFLSRRGFVAVAETNAISTFALCSERDDVARMEVELPTKIHFFYGPNPHDAIGRATAQFGRPRVPPAFTFAPWNDAIFGDASVLEIANQIRELGIPSSVIWTEDWRGGAFDQSDSPNHYALDEEWEVDPTLYPNFQETAAVLHTLGFKWLVYFNSFVEQQSKAWPETAPNGFLIKDATGAPYMFTDAKQNPASMIDLTNPDAVNWAAGKMAAAIALGADGWMGDFGEWLPTDAVLQGGSGLDLHDIYPKLWQQAQRQALDTATAVDGVERLSFVRSGWLGSPPLVDVFWPGDQRTDFELDDGMPNVIPMGVGAGLSGISSFGSDIAGYQNATNPPSSKELFFRWTELGAWSPVMRSHHGSYPLLNWSWRSDADSTAHWTTYAKLHMALAPIFRSLAQAAHDTGISIWRGLPVEFPNDTSVWPIVDEVMLGPSILVAPVQTMGATSRSVYLPAGTWYPWSGGASIAGAQTSSPDVPIDQIPVYVQAGAIVPTYPDVVRTLILDQSIVANASNAADDRVVYVFSGASGSFTEVADAGGLTYATSAGAGATVTFEGAGLASCAATPVAPCVTTTTRTTTAYVTGPGTLVTPAATVVVTGGSVTRQLTIVVRS